MLQVECKPDSPEVNVYPLRIESIELNGVDSSASGSLGNSALVSILQTNDLAKPTLRCSPLVAALLGYWHWENSSNPGAIGCLCRVPGNKYKKRQNMKRLVFGLFLGIFVIALSPAHATTYLGGFEDTVGGDYDYNDIVFSLSGSGLVLDSNGTWYAQSAATLGTSGTPFWNHASGDGPQDNVGYCVYGGGNCNGGIALDAGADFLASSSKGSVNDVTFTPVTSTASVILGITADSDEIGWFLTSSPGTINWITSSTPFTPGGTFGLVGCNDWTGSRCIGNEFYSVTADGNGNDPISHFAFFGPAPVATPEPGAIAMLGFGLLGLVGLRRRSALLS